MNAGETVQEGYFVSHQPFEPQLTNVVEPEGCHQLVAPPTGTTTTSRKPLTLNARKLGSLGRKTTKRPRKPASCILHDDAGFFKLEADLSPEEPFKLADRGLNDISPKSSDSGFVTEPDSLAPQMPDERMELFLGTSFHCADGSYAAQELRRKREKEACKDISCVIQDKLYVGGVHNVKCPSNFTKQGRHITKVVTAMASKPDDLQKDLPTGVEHTMIEIKDRGSEDIQQFFEKVNNIIESDGATLIHCHSGISRSVTFCLAYLIGRKGYSLNEAMSFMNEKRPISNPNLGFIGQLSKYARQILTDSDGKLSVDSGLGSLDSYNDMD